MCPDNVTQLKQEGNVLMMFPTSPSFDVWRACAAIDWFEPVQTSKKEKLGST